MWYRAPRPFGGAEPPAGGGPAATHRWGGKGGWGKGGLLAPFNRITLREVFVFAVAIVRPASLSRSGRLRADQ